MEANNAAAMREALEFVKRYLRLALQVCGDTKYFAGCMNVAANRCSDALAAPPRNCDVGTAEEQRRRYDEWRNHDELRAALGKDEFEWAQMPYEEGGEK